MVRFQEERGDIRILVAPDHATPVSIRTHSGEPVPFILSGPGVASDGNDHYTEAAATRCTPINGPVLFDRFIKHSW